MLFRSCKIVLVMPVRVVKEGTDHYGIEDRQSRKKETGNQRQGVFLSVMISLVWECANFHFAIANSPWVIVLFVLFAVIVAINIFLFLNGSY